MMLALSFLEFIGLILGFVLIVILIYILLYEYKLMRTKRAAKVIVKPKE